MKYSDMLIRLTIALLALAVLGYVGVFAYVSLTDPLRTVEAEETVYRESVEISGLVVREETVLQSSLPYASVSAVHGLRAAAGDELGIGYDSEAALLLAEQIAALRQELRLAETVLEGSGEESDPAERAEDARSAVLSFCADLARHEVGDLRSESLLLRSLVFENGTKLTKQELTSLRQELLQLQQKQRADRSRSETLPAPASGLFSPLLDGREDLSPTTLTGLTVQSLENLIGRSGSIRERSYGKLVAGSSWYLAALVDELSAAAIAPGEELQLDLSRYRAGVQPVTVQSVSPADGGYCAVVFSCSVGLAETLSLREVSCPLITGSTTGLQLPEEALHRDESGQGYVYYRGGDTVCRADVTVLRQGDGSMLVKSEVLRHGSEVFVGGSKRLYDGKVL